MKTLFAHDLKAARQKSALTQKDVYTLMDISKKELMALEAGRKLPSLVQTAMLSFIYNRSFPSLFDAISEEAKQKLFQMLPSLPEPVGGSLSNFTRENTLKRLEQRLVDYLTKRNADA